MIGPDDYPVYNHKERPGIGKDHLGRFYYNCFSISLTKDDLGKYFPYLFSDFLFHYNQYSSHSGTCEKCIALHKVYTFNDVDRSAFDKKCWQKSWSYDDQDIGESEFYYCPWIGEILSASEIEPIREYEFSQIYRGLERPSVEPIDAIIGIDSAGYYKDSFDDKYWFKFQKIIFPQTSFVCPIWGTLFSRGFITQKAEISFLNMWFLSIFYCMSKITDSTQRVYLEERDFNQLHSKLFNFIFPVPQVWVDVIPKPPPGSDWKQWQRQNQSKSLPQRVDFLFTYKGKRHIVELDGKTHYAEKMGGQWQPSESRYRQTLSDTRWLRYCGFEVHRFTNEEIIELYDPDSPNEANIEEFVKILSSEGIELEEMVFWEKSEIA